MKKLHLYQVVLSLLSVAAWLKLNVAAISCALIMSDFVRTRQECRDVTSFTGADDLTRSSYVPDTEVQRHINHHSPVIWNNRVPWHNMHPAICAQMERERCLLHPHAWPRVIDQNHDMATCRWPLSSAIRRRSYSRDETRDAIRIHTKNEIHEMIADRYWKQQLPDGAFIFLPLSHLIYHALPSASLMTDLIWSFRISGLLDITWRYFDIFGDHSGTSLWWDFPMVSHQNVVCVPRWQLGTGASDVYNVYIYIILYYIISYNIISYYIIFY